ncbi:hypothetical protein H5T87_03245 [bacterium]|nr:hypothetical protein [bacterium]
MRPSKAVLYSRLFMQIIIVFLGVLIVLQGIVREATLIYDFVGVAIVLYGIYRLYGTLQLLLKGEKSDER